MQCLLQASEKSANQTEFSEIMKNCTNLDQVIIHAEYIIYEGDHSEK